MLINVIIGWIIPWCIASYFLRQDSSVLLLFTFCKTMFEFCLVLSSRLVSDG